MSVSVSAVSITFSGSRSSPWGPWSWMTSFSVPAIFSVSPFLNHWRKRTLCVFFLMTTNIKTEWEITMAKTTGCLSWWRRPHQYFYTPSPDKIRSIKSKLNTLATLLICSTFLPFLFTSLFHLIWLWRLFFLKLTIIGCRTRSMKYKSYTVKWNGFCFLWLGKRKISDLLHHTLRYTVQLSMIQHLIIW